MITGRRLLITINITAAILATITAFSFISHGDYGLATVFGSLALLNLYIAYNNITRLKA